MSVRPVPASWLEPIRGAGRRNTMRVVLSQGPTVLLFVSGCVLTAAGCSAEPARQVTGDSVGSSVNNPTTPPLECEDDAYVEGIFDHFGRGRGADDPADLARPYMRAGATTVVEEAGASATVYVVTENRDETVAVITASNWGKGWLTDGVRSCAHASDGSAG